MIKYYLYNILFFTLTLFVTGCSSSNKVQIVNLTKPKSHHKWEHVVKKGETLHVIAWEYGLDYKKIAILNGVKSPYSIYQGMRLNLNYSDKKSKVQKTKRLPRVKKHVPKQSVKYIKWSYPLQKNNFSKNLRTSNTDKGLDIYVPRGQDVLAATAGKVVYAGSGLKGYGKLIILKHEGDYLSAYAYNDRILVKEGQEVRLGEKIAKSGLRDDGMAVLHFQIRYQGKPVSPARYIS